LTRIDDFVRPVRFRRHIAIARALFVFALTLRLYFCCGFILGDDAIEFPCCAPSWSRAPSGTISSTRVSAARC